jgi:hypothetical protein
MIKYVSENFEEKKFDQRMPVSDKVKEILSIFNKKGSYDLGTYRTDFVFDTALNPKFIEITCQFSLNAFFKHLFTTVIPKNDTHNSFTRQEKPAPTLF